MGGIGNPQPGYTLTTTTIYIMMVVMGLPVIMGTISGYLFGREIHECER